MEKKEIYTPMERNLVAGAQVLQNLNKALKLDLMLLELEASVGLMDGMPLPRLAAEEGAKDGQ